MSSWANLIRFAQNWSAQSPLKFILYNLHEQTAPSWRVGRLKSSKSAKWKWKTWISPWILVEIGICSDRIQALDLPYNASHTSVMNRPLLPEALASWNPQNQQNRRNGNKKPEYLHQFLCELESVSVEFKHSSPSKIHPIEASWTDRSLLKRWPVEILKISKIGETSEKNWISPWVLVLIGICFDAIQVLHPL